MKFWVALLLCLTLAACSKPQPPPTIEEKVLMQAFSAFVAALTYDEVCNKNDPRSRYEDLKKPENITILGTQQMLAARVGGVWHVRFPDKPVEDGVKVLINIQEKLQAAAKKTLVEKGCESEEAKASARAYELYSKAHAGLIYEMIDKTIEKEGGKVTSMEEIEAAGKPKSKLKEEGPQ